ncbi:MAG: PadR family transcriptional regulator [bacterium]
MLPFQHLQKSNTKDNLWLYILFFLEKKGSAYAWELQSLIEQSFDFKPGRITPYRVLYRLEKQGLVKSQAEEIKRVYQITKNGEKELAKAREFFQKLSQELKHD